MWWKYFEQNMKNYQIAYSKWKELNQIVLGKRALYFSVGVFLFGKRHLDSPEGQVEVKSPIIQSYFWHLWFKLRNFFPLKNTLSIKHPITIRCFIFLRWSCSAGGTDSSITSLHNIVFHQTVLPTMFLFTQPCWLFFTPLWPSIEISLLLCDSTSIVSILQSWYLGSILLHPWPRSSVKDFSISMETYILVIDLNLHYTSNIKKIQKKG